MSLANSSEEHSLHNPPADCPSPALTPIQVIGIGLEGAAGLSPLVQQRVAASHLLVGSDRHLSYFPHHPGQRLPLGNLQTTLQTLRQWLAQSESATPLVSILTSGDPLFFGLGRLLLEEFPADLITFHPHLSSVQLAFSRVKLSWHDARVISAHGRSLDELTQALQQGTPKLAIFTDPTHSPSAIAQLLRSLDLATLYQLWVCENLGSDTEQVQCFSPAHFPEQSFAPLNLVILVRQTQKPLQDMPLDLQTLPLLGLPDASFLSFSDRPGLMTKREIRLLALGELALQPHQIVWDIGAGTGSVSIEIARLCPTSTIYAIEKTAAGFSLIQQNRQRFAVPNLIAVSGSAPEMLATLPPPDRIFLGGSGGHLEAILEHCDRVLSPQGRLVLALATLEHLTLTLSWLKANPQWQHHLLQAQIAKSVAIADLTRFTPLNPVTLITLTKP
ncbi:MAG: precorrin-6y C5,15-methyltransferase (decarboxylating) subunit CbiE [Oculatellaceae cyanobacterium Prado106]|nr:precorrin-6y C5,15-methyltransferase (decarboxylating) subunit CbiE [Oculatellaceae cyanobacterium Prado106]